MLNEVRLLLDLTVRLQVFAEGVKVVEARYFDIVLSQVDTMFRDILMRVKFDKLDGLTKSELTKLVVTLKQSQTRLYSIYLDKILKRLEAFMMASLKVNRIVWAWATRAIELGSEDVEIPSDEEASDIIVGVNKRGGFSALYGLAAISKGSKSLWPKILSEPMPSNGAYMRDFVRSLMGSAAVGLENTLRSGYANALSPQQTAAQAEKHLNKVKGQAEAVIATSMQHIASVVSASIASAMHGRYRWLSVIDGNTTEVCLNRNGKIYTYGAGPLPPAHIRCRSSVQPYRGDSSKPESFYSWTKRQPTFMQDFTLGDKGGALLRAEKLAAKDVTKLTDPKAMSIDEFSNSAKLVIRGEP